MITLLSGDGESSSKGFLEIFLIQGENKISEVLNTIKVYRGNKI